MLKDLGRLYFFTKCTDGFAYAQKCAKFLNQNFKNVAKLHIKYSQNKQKGNQCFPIQYQHAPLELRSAIRSQQPPEASTLNCTSCL